jgi:hypothetical protein
MVVTEVVYSAAVNGDLNVLREYFASGDRDPIHLGSQPRGLVEWRLWEPLPVRRSLDWLGSPHIAAHAYPE